MKKRFFDLNLAVKLEEQEAYVFKRKEDDIFLTFKELKQCQVTEVETYKVAYKKDEHHVKFEEIAYQTLNSEAFCVIKKELEAAS